MKKRGKALLFAFMASFALAAGLSLFLIASPAQAQVFTDWDINLGAASPLDIIVAIINWGLGILALVAVGIILWGGFTWMTAGGNEENVEKAKRILRNGAIGLVLILAAWGIAAYIINVLLGATGAGEGGTGAGTPHDTDNDIVGRFHVDHTNPQSDEIDVVLCSIVAVTFSLPVVQDTVLEQSMDTPQEILDQGYQEFENFELYIPEYVDQSGVEQDALYHGDACSDSYQCRSSNCIEGACLGNQITGTIEFFESGYGFSFYPLYDYQESTVYRVRLQTGEDGILGEDEVLAATYSLSPSDPLHTWKFTTGTETDEVPPQVNVAGSIIPEDGETDVCMRAPIQAQFNESMDPASIRSDAIWLYDFAPAGDYNANFSPSLYPMQAPRMVTFNEVDDAFISGSQDVLAEFTEYSFNLYSGDPDNNFSGGMRDMCGNPLDGNYNGVAEGHDPAWAGGDDFIDPTSAVTSQDGGGNWSFPWQFTTGNDPVCAPVINTVGADLPNYYSEDADASGGPSAADSHQIDVQGRYLAPALDIDLANNRSAAGPNCFDTNHWVSQGCLLTTAYTQLLFRTPVGSVTGPVEVETTSGETSSADYVSISSPYISTTSPYAGPVGQFVTVKGRNFGDDKDQEGGEVHFVWDGGTQRVPAEFPCDDSWDNTQIVIRVPEGIPENSNIQVIKPENGNKYSNYTAFELTEDEPGPGLCELVPECSDTGLEPVRAYGENFGPSDSENNVYFDEFEAPNVTAWDAFDPNDGLDYNYVEADRSPVQDQETYDVKVRSTDDKPLSNGLDYEIPCTPAPEMFFYNGCQVDAGLLYLPMPRYNMDDACPNGLVDFAFTDDMVDASVQSAFSIFQCAAEGEGCETPVDGTWSQAVFLPGEYVGDPNETTNYEKYSFDPAGDLEADAWYRVTVSSAATNNGGTALVQDYAWNFHVRTTGACSADHTVLYPYSKLINHHDPADPCDGEDHEFNGTAYNEECISLGIDTWHWFIQNEAGWEGKEILRFQSGDVEKNKSGQNASQVNVCTQGDGEDNFGNVTVNAEPLDDNDQPMTDAADSLVVVDFGYCIDDTDCQSVPGCEESVCDLVSHHCTPVITGFSPDVAGEGGCVTVNGCYFGPSRLGGSYCECASGDDSCLVAVGASYCMLPDFSKCYIDEDDENAACQAADAAPIGDGRLEIPLGSETNYLENQSQCEDTWSDSYMIGQINQGNASGPLTIFSYYGLDDASDGSINITQNPTPCLCRVDPKSGEEGDEIDFYGLNFGNSGTASFNGSAGRLTSSPASWSATSALDGPVPAGAVSGHSPADEGVFLNTNGADSNALDFGVSCNSNYDCSTECCVNEQCVSEDQCNVCIDKTDCLEASGCGGDCVDGVCDPVITELAPGSGGEGQPVTVQGCHFGTPPGLNNSNNDSYVGFGDNDAPAELICNDAYPWNNHEIIVKAPAGQGIFGGIGESAVVVHRDTGDDDPDTGASVLKNSNAATFFEDATCEGVIYPELCTLNPDHGPYGATIDFVGNNFRQLHDEYCYCENPQNPELNCKIPANIGYQYCTVTYDVTLYVDPDFPSQECTMDMDNYDSTLEACEAADPDDPSIACDIPLGGTSCSVSGLTYDCYVDENDQNASCVEGAPGYLDEGGFAEFPIDERIDGSAYQSAYQSDSLVSAVVPDAAESGDAYMGVVTSDGRECTSNGLDFALSCGDCDDCENDNHCIDPGNPGMCTSETAGFCRQFGECCGNTGCVFDANADPADDPGNCMERPKLISLTPGKIRLYVNPNDTSETCQTAGGCIAEDPNSQRTCEVNENETSCAIDAYGVCPNAAVSLTFSETMAGADDNSIKLFDGQGEIDIDVETTGARVDIILNELMDPATGPFELEIGPGAVSASSGLSLDCKHNTAFGDCANNDTALSIGFDTTEDACAPDNVQITASSLTEEEIGQSHAFLFTEAGEEDSFSADVYASDGQAIQEVPGSYNWTYDWEPQFATVEEMENTGCVWAGVITGSEGYEDDRKSQTITAGTVPEDIQPVLNTIEVTIEGDGTLGYADSINGSTTVAILECAGDVASYHNEDYNFSLIYCRGTGDDELPDFLAPDNVVETTGGAPGEDFQRQLLLTTDDPDNQDVIGLRIYDNNPVSESKEPGLWYTTEATNPVSGYSSLDVAGYKAIRVGTSTYIAGSNVDGPGYTNIFLLSHNEGAGSETVEVYDQMLNNLMLNDHIGNVFTNTDPANPVTGTCDFNADYVARDTQRANSLGTIKYYLDNFRDSGLGSNDFPPLKKGTYVKEMTTSAWPSWSAKFGNDLGTALPADPINEFGACDFDNYEAATCWNAQAKQFRCPEGSRVFIYRALNGGANYSLFANMEYAGPWQGSTVNACSGLAEAPDGCSCVNYEISE